MKSPLTLPALLAASLLLGACGSAPSSSTSADRTPPRVTLDALPGTVRPGKVQVQATASDDVAVREVRFYLNDKLVDTDRTEPYQTTYDLSQSGSFVLKAVAVDTSGNESAPATQTVRVSNDTTAPQLTVEAPGTITQPGVYKITVRASDDIQIAYVDAALTLNLPGGALTQRQRFDAPQDVAQAEWSFDLPISDSSFNGTHSLTLVAYDAAGNASAPLTRTVVVNVPAGQPQPPVTTPTTGDTVAPTVRLTLPTTTITQAGNYTVRVEASDNVAVTSLRAELALTGGPVVPLTLSPSQTEFVVPVDASYRAFNGPATLTVFARDAAGNEGSDRQALTLRLP